ncbi:transcriptional regulator Brz [Halobacterium rubrum]|uniref:transcriptional regulator Brz n=1 Tax=Halobacterium TaxID=2239 RepID=UPI001F393D3D|nr:MULTISPECIES: transcriptional regulator Brz [Halobacterium]MDH5019758.1 transcriptional regulator [Halobacterium rubrum]
MPITELQCPRCGTEVKMGLPMGATVKSVTAAEEPEPSDDDGKKLRALRCRNDHEFAVVFEL